MPCTSREPRGKQAAGRAVGRALGRFFRPNGLAWTLRQGSAHCGLQADPAAISFRQ